MVRVPPGFCSSPLSQFGQSINQLFIEVLGPGDIQVSYSWTLISECPQFSVGTEMQKNPYCWEYLNKH